MKGLAASIKTIEKAGFSHIKVELEANLQRRDVFNSESHCQTFLKKNISKETLDIINYFRFYRDGSVDSELTFTLPVKESVRIIEVINAWNLLAKATGDHMEVHGAGMHIAILTGPVYPCSVDLSGPNLDNFITEVTKLLPALYIAGASGDFTRLLNYRRPQITNNTKYSAIYLRRNASMEYRLFETCYQRPEAIFEFIGVIAKTLEFYIDPTKKVAPLSKEFPIYEGKGLKGFTDLPTQIEVLKKTIGLVRPAGMTTKEFLDKRKVSLSLTACRIKNAAKIAKLKMAYAEHYKAFKAVREQPLDEFQLDNITYYKREMPGHDDDYYWSLVTGEKATIEDEQTYINQNITNERATHVVMV